MFEQILYDVSNGILDSSGLGSLDLQAAGQGEVTVNAYGWFLEVLMNYQHALEEELDMGWVAEERMVRIMMAVKELREVPESE